MLERFSRIYNTTDMHMKAASFICVGDAHRMIRHNGFMRVLEAAKAMSSHHRLCGFIYRDLQSKVPVLGPDYTISAKCLYRHLAP
jgi:hypothetical protein